jgi:hypothetical protein
VGGGGNGANLDPALVTDHSITVLTASFRIFLACSKLVSYFTALVLIDQGMGAPLFLYGLRKSKASFKASNKA